MTRIFSILVVLALVACSLCYTVIPLEANRVTRPVQRMLATKTAPAGSSITNSSKNSSITITNSTTNTTANSTTNSTKNSSTNTTTNSTANSTNSITNSTVNSTKNSTTNSTTNSTVSSPTADIALSNVNAISYTGKIQIGTPPQTFSVIFDTGFPDMMFYAKCESCSKNVTQFNPSASSTVEDQSFNLTFDYYTAYNNFEGAVYEDYITVGQNFTVLGEFLVVDTPSTINSQYSGIVGLGFQSSLLYTLTQLLQVAETNIPQVFSIHLTSETNQVGSTLILGGYNTTIAPQGFTNYTVSQRNTWQLNASAFGFAGQQYSEDNAKLEVILASGLPYIVGAAGLFNNLLSSSELPPTVACSNLPNGSFYITIGEDQYGIPATSLYTNQSGTCTLNVQAGNEDDYNLAENQILLGIPFFQNYYALFDIENQMIGLANLPGSNSSIPAATNTTTGKTGRRTPTPPSSAVTLATSIFTLFASILYLLL